MSLVSTSVSAALAAASAFSTITSGAPQPTHSSYGIPATVIPTHVVVDQTIPRAEPSATSVEQPFGLWPVLAFDILQAFGGAGNLLLVLTLMYSKRVSRNATWLNFCVVWVVSTVSYTLLGIAGQQIGPEPDFGFCLFQASLVYGAPILDIFGMLSLVIQLWDITRRMLNHEDDKNSKRRVLFLLIMPYFIWMVIILNTVAEGLSNPSLVTREVSHTYCMINSQVPGAVNAVLIGTAMVAILGFEASIIRVLLKHRKVYASLNQRNHIPMSIILRVGAFTILAFSAIVVSIVFVSKIFTPTALISLGVMPGISFLIFGTQSDFLEVWMFWRRPAPGPKRFSEQSLASTTTAASINSVYKPYKKEHDF